MKFFWFDIHDLSSCFDSGTVVLFGYLENGQVSCIRIDHIPRLAWCLVQQGSSIEECKREVLQTLKNRRNPIWNDQDIIEQKVKIDGPYLKKYCFEKQMELIQDHMEQLPGNNRAYCKNNSYLRIQYPSCNPIIPCEQILPGRHFKQLLMNPGTGVHRVLIEQQIYGPCWLEIEKAQFIRAESNKKSTCSIEYTVPSLSCIKVSSSTSSLISPNFRVLSVALHWSHEMVPKLTGFAAQLNLWNPELKLSTEIEVDEKEEEEETKEQINSWTYSSLPEEEKEERKTELELLYELIVNIIPQCDIIMGYQWHEVELHKIMKRLQYYSSLPTNSETSLLLKKLKWNLLGRLKHSNLVKQNSTTISISSSTTNLFSSWRDSSVLFAGRLIMDAYKSAVLYLSKPKSHLYTIESLATEFLQENPQDINCLWQNPSSKKSLSLSSNYIWKLMELHEILNLTFAITTIAGNTWGNTLNNERSSLNDWLLLHAFWEKGFLLPSSSSYEKKEATKEEKEEEEEKEKESPTKKRKENSSSSSSSYTNNKKEKKEKEDKPISGKYKGGYVLEPEIGLSHKVVLLDIKSSYPSSIVKFNICFSTLPYWKTEENGYTKELIPEYSRLIQKYPKCDPKETPGVISSIAAILLERREQIQHQLKEEKTPYIKSCLKAKQLALKLIANCMYGCLAFQTDSSLFFARPLAKLVTACGRLVLKEALSQVKKTSKRKKWGLKVIYGDTDSIMIKMPLAGNMKKVVFISNKLLKDINERTPGISMKVEGLFPYIILYKKKKYAALSITSSFLTSPILEEEKEKEEDEETEDEEEEKKIEEEEVSWYLQDVIFKGMEVVKSDWCPFVSRICHSLLCLLLAHSRLLRYQSVKKQNNSIQKNMKEFKNLLKDYLKNIPNQVMQAPLEDFVIVKTLSHKLNAFIETNQNSPHIQAAYLLQQLGYDVPLYSQIPYLVISPPYSPHKNIYVSSSIRPFDKEAIVPFFPIGLPYEIARRNVDQIELDLEYYYEKQILPPLERILEPFHLFTSGEIKSLIEP